MRWIFGRETADAPPNTGGDGRWLSNGILLARSATLLRDILGEALGEPPAWARPLSFTDYFGIRHRRFRDQLAHMLADADERAGSIAGLVS
jgi:hypothetical protein